MKSLLALLVLVSGTQAFAADKVMKNVECSIDNTKTGKISGITAKTTDHNPSSDDPNEIWLRAAIPGFPGLYVQIWSTPGPVTAEQEIDLRVKTKAQLGQYDMIAWSSGYADVSLGVTAPGASKVSFEISCMAVDE